MIECESYQKESNNFMLSRQFFFCSAEAQNKQGHKECTGRCILFSTKANGFHHLGEFPVVTGLCGGCWSTMKQNKNHITLQI